MLLPRTHQTKSSTRPTLSHVHLAFVLCVQHNACLRSNPNKWWGALGVKAMRLENGERQWHVAWSGRDDQGNPWHDTWEPTRNVTKDLIAEFLADRKQGVRRAITVDPRPLDTVVQCAIASSVQRGAQTTFGIKFVTPILALSLRDLAEYFITSVEDRYGLVRGHAPTCPGEETVELCLKVQEDVGDFCDFDTIIKSGKGTKNLVFQGDRRQNFDGLVIAYLKLRYTNNKNIPGLVTFEAEHHSVYLNGATGRLTGPHQLLGWLQDEANMAQVRKHVRAILPSSHPLAQAGWTDLLPSQHELTTPVGFAAP